MFCFQFCPLTPKLLFAFQQFCSCLSCKMPALLPNMNIHAYQLLSESHFLQISSISLITELFLHTQFIFIRPKHNPVQQGQEWLYFPFTENMNFIYGIPSLKHGHFSCQQILASNLDCLQLSEISLESRLFVSFFKSNRFKRKKESQIFQNFHACRFL